MSVPTDEERDAALVAALNEPGPARTWFEHIENRPTKYADLSDDRQLGERVVQFELTKLPFAVLGKAGEFLATCEKAAGLMVRRDNYSGVQVFLRPTEEDIQARIRDAAQRWDTSADQYDACLVDRERPGDWNTRNAVESWCNTTGIAYPWAE